VGGHPFIEMPSGTENADPGVFLGRTWALTPGQGTPGERVSAVEALVEATGGIPYFVDADEHDAWVAGVVQVPRILASVLARVASESEAWRELVPLAGHSFDDGTRWSAHGELDGRDLALTNGTALVSWLDRVMDDLYRWREAVAESREAELLQRFAAAQAARERWQMDRNKERKQRT
jgi:prephenate dehydrogenase